MKDIVEIRWHGRGGQGAKTASLLLADAAFNTGKYVQGFPEYGPERMGAPITAYNRISSERSTVHSNIYYPDYVVVVDETLIGPVDVTAGLKKEGAIVINSSKSPAELRPLLKGYEGKVCTIDAGKISEEELGKNFPNTPMLAAIVKVTGVIGEEEFIKDMEGSFKHKFASKPQVIEGNMRALKRSLEEVQVGCSHLAKDMTPDVTWKEITPGCNIYEGGTSATVETGDWRTMKPIIDWDKCKQCLLCAPVCPDMSIPVGADGKRGEFDYFFCKGCGICANACPFGAITMVKNTK